MKLVLRFENEDDFKEFTSCSYFQDNRFFKNYFSARSAWRKKIPKNVICPAQCVSKKIGSFFSVKWTTAILFLPPSPVCFCRFEDQANVKNSRLICVSKREVFLVLGFEKNLYPICVSKMNLFSVAVWKSTYYKENI